MRYIRKPKWVPDCLFSEDAVPPLSSYEATKRWHSYNSGLLSDILLGEQFYLCAYSEVCFDSRSIGFHLDHIKPKSRFPQLTFSHKNIVASALSSPDLEYFKGDIFGGHSKQNHFDRKFFLSPLRSFRDIDYLIYLSDGRVIPSPNKSKRYQRKADHTIKALNLNASCLVNWRKRWIEELDMVIDDHLDEEMSIFHLACIDLLPRSGRLGEFFSATRQRFGKIGRKVLTAHVKEFR